VSERSARTRRERAEERRRQKRKKSIGLRLLVIAIIVCLVVVIGKIAIEKYGLLRLIGGDIMEDSPPIAGEAGQIADEYPDSERVNILFLGTNQDLSDTIMVLSFDTQAQLMDLISVPRDTYYERPQYTDPALQKINSVFKSEAFDGLEKGFDAAASAVSDVLCGTPIHYFARITDEGVVRVVDAMGGVEMDVPQDMDYEDAGQDLYIHLKAGPQTLDGEHAVQYLRFRSGYANADLGRISAQQEFLKAAFKKSSGIGFPKVATAVLKELGGGNTNISRTMMVRLGSQAVGMDGSALKTWMVPGTAGMQNGASYYFADEAATLAMMREIYERGAEADGQDATAGASGE